MMIRKINESLFRGMGLVVLIVASLFSLLEAGLNAGRTEYFNQPPTIRHLSPDSLTVEWTLFPQFNKTTHYQVQLNHALYGASTKQTSKTLTRLQPGGTYKIAVVTYDSGSAVGVSSPTTVLMAPAAPATLSAYDIGTASVGLMWTGVETATSYRIYQSPDKLLVELDAAENKYLLTGFTPGTQVTLKMTAVNATGESVYSADLRVQLLPVGPVVSIVEDLIGQTFFAIRWKPVDNAVAYKIIVNDSEVASVGANISEYRIENLPAGTTVSVKMTVLNATGVSETSEPLIVQLIPATPVLAVAQVSSYSCTLQWSVANGATYYKIYLDDQWAIQNVPSTINTVTLTEHITPGKTANYTVRASNGTGESPHSNKVTVTFTATSAIVREAGDLETVQASLYQFSDQEMPSSMQGKPLVWVYFPPELVGPELALEVSYFDFLTRRPEMAAVRFVGVFTREIVKLKRIRRGNLSWKRASVGNDIRIPGPLPMVRFYGPEGKLRNSIRIPMSIFGPDEIYKDLPESIEKNENMLQLYQENQQAFDALHTPTN